ncbi:MULTISPECIES: DUF4169 family protein [unclassified Afipia]|uniref:DUF4169 family protein n=1 Tax=unclassified Afipia TaxID=2642050 RepID=UPI000413EC48|nr:MULTISPECIES: DUF4169 family protein [unclassified Afipia]
MGDLVNLKQIKKRIAREEADKQAETNRIRFGRTKGERSRDERQAQRASNILDQHRIDDGTPA